MVELLEIELVTEALRSIEMEDVGDSVLELLIDEELVGERDLEVEGKGVIDWE